MTLPKSAAELAEEFASSYGPPGKRQHVNQAFMAGHAAGMAEAGELARAVEDYFKAPLMDHSAALIAGDCLRSALLDFKALAGEK